VGEPITPRANAAPHMGEVAGRPVALDYGDVAGEYAALHERAGLVDHSSRGRMTFTGSRAADVLSGLVTNDVLALRPLEGQYAAALTPKGKIIADVRIFRRSEDECLVDIPSRAVEGWNAMVRKFVNPRLARYADVSTALTMIGLFGPEASRVLARATGASAEALAALGAYAHTVARTEHGDLMIAHVPAISAPGFALFLSAAEAGWLWSTLEAAGADPVGLTAWDTARVEAGRAEWGVDIDDSTLTQEANLEELSAISYTKGCYTGQETVARVHFRGHVNRHLRGLHFEGGALPPRGADVLDAEGSSVGDVRSAVQSPRFGAIAMGMIRREVEPGAAIVARWDGNEAAGYVQALPFAD
jgi:tRNA-modifying protein YgfZ